MEKERSGIDKALIRIQKSRIESIRRHKEEARKIIEEEDRHSWFWRMTHATNIREWYPWSWDEDEKDAKAFLEELET